MAHHLKVLRNTGLIVAERDALDDRVDNEALGGLLAQTLGIMAPFWFGFIGSALLVAVLWRQFALIVHAGDTPPAADESA